MHQRGRRPAAGRRAARARNITPSARRASAEEPADAPVPAAAMSVRQARRPVARDEARAEAPMAATAASTALTVHRPLGAVLAAGRAHGRASAPTGQYLGNAMASAHFDVYGVPFQEIKFNFNAPAITDGADMTEAIEIVQQTLMPHLRDALLKLHKDVDEGRIDPGLLSGRDAYLRVRKPKLTTNMMNTGEDARVYLTEAGKNWNGANRHNAIFSIGFPRYGIMTDTNKRHFWETIWHRRKEPESIGIIYFDSQTAEWDREDGENDEAMDVDFGGM